MKDKLKTIENIFLIISAAAIGGMSESYALMSVIVLLLGIFAHVMQKKKTLLVIALIVLSLMLNVLSAGLVSRLSMLPDFKFLLAIRNTIHSLLLPFINYKYLPLKAGVLIITYLMAVSLKRVGTIAVQKFLFSHFMKQLSLVISVIALSFFIPCFLLTDIIALRMESFAYLLFLLFVFHYFMSYGWANGQESQDVK